MHPGELGADVVKIAVSRSGIGETVVFGRSYKMPANSAVLPTTQTRGDHEEMCLAAGASVAAVRSIEPADQIVRDMMTHAWALIGGNNVKYPPETGRR